MPSMITIYKNKSLQTTKNAMLCLMAMTFLLACNSKKTEPVVESASVESSTEMTLTPEQQKAIGLTLDTITYRNLSTSLQANGKLELPPQNRAKVSILAGGIVKTIAVKEGEYVNEGQLLATLENMDLLQVQQDFLESNTNLVFLKAEFERQKELQKDNINAAKSVQSAENNYNSALVRQKTLEQKLKLYNINPQTLTAEKIRPSFTILSPITGHITRINISIGQFVDPNSMVFEIVDNRFLHIDLTIFEQDVHKVHVGQTLSFSDANDPMHTHTAKIFSINKSFEPNQQATIAHAKIMDVTETLLPGMFIQARINIDQNMISTLPDEAIISNGNEHYIFVVTEPDHFKEIQVRSGVSDMGFTEVIPLEELAKGSKVVVKGAYYLFSQLTKGEGEHHD
ncbi:MAG: efflux RND transporter periplasmic adaptor subunit [Saprospiraceae bacterium]